MIDLNLQKLKEYGQRVLNCGGEIASVETKKMEGGYSPAEISRITLTLADSPQPLSLVQKVTFPSEVQVMLALLDLTDAHSLPKVIDYAWNPASDEESANWYITPFYDGTPLTFQDEVPTDVVCSLARLHHHFQEQTERFASLYRVDVSFFENTLMSAVKALEEAVRETQNPIFEQGLVQLRKTQKNEQIFQALEYLPVTLTHGDMHPVNLIHLQKGRTMLIDWGNARIAPAMLDIANLIELDSENWHTYLDAWQEVLGTPMDPRLAQLGYHWATIMVNTMYLPHAVKFSPPEHVGKMVNKVVEAERFIGELLLAA